jgi:hypothetical protein
MLKGCIRSDNRELISSAWRTGNAFERMRGLLFREPLGFDEALLIDRCASVHTCGMSYPLDLAFLDREGVVRKLVAGVDPWRMSVCFGASMTLELRVGMIEKLGLHKGQSLVWTNI